MPISQTSQGTFYQKVLILGLPKNLLKFYRLILLHLSTLAIILTQGCLKAGLLGLVLNIQCLGGTGDVINCLYLKRIYWFSAQGVLLSS